MATAALSPESQASDMPADEKATTRTRALAVIHQFVRSNAFIICVAMAALSVASLGERIWRANGHGWDGTAYADMVQDFDGEVRAGLDSYRVPRILPSLILNKALWLLQIEATDHVVVVAFIVLNVLLVGLTAWMWTWVADEMSISLGGKWLGTFGLIVNFSILKHAAYYPVLTDVGGAALSMAMVYCYVARRHLMLFAVTVLGMFTWPTLLMQGAGLLLFPRPTEAIPTTRAPWRLNYLLAGIATGIVSYTVFKYAGRHYQTWFFVPRNELILFSLAAVPIYLFLGLTPLLDCANQYRIHRYLTLRFVARSGLVLAGLFAFVMFRQALAAKPTIMDSKTYVRMISVIAVLRPANFLLAHVVYFGPIVLLAIFYWRSVCRQVNLLGQGFLVAVTIGIVHSIDAESRHMVSVLPLLIPVVVKAIDHRGWSWPQYGCIGVLALFMSKFWLTINQGPFTGNALVFPDQYYFMSHGHAMNDDMYFIQGAVILAAAVLIYAVCIAPFRAESKTLDLDQASATA